MGDVPRVSRRARAAALDRRRRHPGPPRRRAGLRHGRARCAQRAGRPTRTSRPCAPSCSRRSGPAPWGSPPRARWGTAPSTASSCPGTYAAEDELFGIGSALGEAGTGVFELAPLGSAGEMLEDVGQGGRLDAPALGRHRAGPCPTCCCRQDDDPELWRRAAGGVARRLRRGGTAVPPDRRATHGHPLGPPHDAVPLLRLPGLPRAARPAAVGRRAGSRAGRPRGAARHRGLDAVVAGRGRGDGEGVPAHVRARRPARLRAGPRALAGGHGRGARGDAARGGLRRDGPRRRAGAALPPDPQLRHGRPRPRARHDAAPPGPARPRRRRRPHGDDLRRLHAHLHAHPLDAGPQPGRDACRSSTW